MTKEKIALSLALEVMECEREKYRFWAYSELNENDNWERMTYEDAINTIRKMIEDGHGANKTMDKRIKEEGLTDAYLLGKYDGIKQGRADAIDECLQIVQKIKDDHNEFGEQIPINYGTICGIIIAMERLKEKSK